MKKIAVFIMLFTPLVVGQKSFAQSKGGGIYANDAKVTSTVVTGNYASGQGTGVYAEGTTAIVNATVADNKQVAGSVGAVMDGGVVFYVDQQARKGYIVALTEAPSDVKYTYLTWGESGQNITAAADVDNGLQNHNAIIAAQVVRPEIKSTDNPYPKPGDYRDNSRSADTARRAAHWCKEYAEGGKTDWFLPSREQLKKLYVAKEAVNATLSTTQSATELSNGYYWSSTQVDAYDAWYVYFDNGETNTASKTNVAKVRAIREFTY